MGSRLILVLGYVFPCAGRVHLEYLLESKSCHQRLRSFSVINGFAFYPGYLRIPRTSWILMGHLERKGVRRCNIDISRLALQSHLRWVPAPHLEYDHRSSSAICSTKNGTTAGKQKSPLGAGNLIQKGHKLKRQTAHST